MALRRGSRAGVAAQRATSRRHRQLPHHHGLLRPKPAAAGGGSFSGSKWYFRAALSPLANLPPAAQSPLQAGLAYGASPRQLNSVKGTAQVSLAQSPTVSLGDTVHNLSAWAVQIVGAWTFTFGDAYSISMAGASNPANRGMTVGAVYVWRPGTGAVVGVIADTDSVSNTWVATTEAASTLSFTHNSGTFSCQDGDYLVVELFAALAGAANATVTFYHDGTTEASATSNAAFIQVPVLAALGGGTVSDTATDASAHAETLTDAVADVATVSSAHTTTLVDAVLDVGSSTGTASSSGADTVGDAAANAAVHTQVNTDAVTTPPDALVNTQVATQTLADSVGDAGSSTATQAQAAADTVGDGTTTSQAASQGGADGVLDAGLTTAANTSSASDRLVDVLVQAQAATQAVAEVVGDGLASAAANTQAGQDTELDQLLTTMAHAQALADAVADQLASTGTATPSLGDKLLDALAAAQAHTPGAGDAVADALATLQAASNAIGDGLADALAGAEAYSHILVERISDALASAQAAGQAMAEDISEGLAASTTHTPGGFDSGDGIDHMVAVLQHTQQLADALAEALVLVQVHTQQLQDQVVLPFTPPPPGGPLYGPRVPLWRPSLPPQRGYGTHVHNAHLHTWSLRDQVHTPVVQPLPALEDINVVLARYPVVVRDQLVNMHMHTQAMGTAVGGTEWELLLLLAAAAMVQA